MPWQLSILGVQNPLSITSEAYRDAYYDDMDKLNDSPDTSTSNGSVWMIVLMHRWVIKQYYDPSLPVVMTYAKPQTVPQVNRQRKMLR